MKNRDSGGRAARYSWRRSLRRWSVLWILAWAASATVAGQASKALLDVQVQFDLRDLRYNNRYQAVQRRAIEQHVTGRLVEAANRRFPHLRFGEGAQAHVLECVMNTGGSIEADAQPSLQADAVSFHFRLQGPLLSAKPIHSWIFQDVDRYWDAIPDQTTLLRALDRFLGEGEPMEGEGAEVRGEAENRFASLFDAVISAVPVFTDREISHVTGTRFLVIKARRDDYRCSLPDLSEFHVCVDLPDPLGPQRYDFRSRLLNVSGLGTDLRGPIPSQLTGGLVTEAFEPLRGTEASRLDLLAQGSAQVKKKQVYLLRLGPTEMGCLETDPTNFEP